MANSEMANGTANPVLRPRPLLDNRPKDKIIKDLGRRSFLWLFRALSSIFRAPSPARLFSRGAADSNDPATLLDDIPAAAA
jgi:hypothetical protein